LRRHRSAAGAEDWGSKVAILGTAVIGTSLAYRLAAAGADVTVLDRSHVGSGAPR
jgi:glycine/D-amino acid oxidase-like deaminating enzyme